MTYALLFVAGFAAGVTTVLWFLSRSVPEVNQRLEEEFNVPVRDPYVDGIPW